MKRIFISLGLLLFLSCESDELLQDSNDGSIHDPGLSTRTQFDAFTDTEGQNYDTIIFYRTAETQSFRLPFGEGQYSIDPIYDGFLHFNRATGEIYKSSVSGIYYPVRFTNGQISLTSYVLISGIWYGGGSYPRTGMVRPYYNGDPALAIPEGSKLDTPPAGEPSLTSQGVVIDFRTGIIDIEKSLANNIFGKHAKDGECKKFRLYFRLNDESNFAINYTEITVCYKTKCKKSTFNSPLAAEEAPPTCPPRCTIDIVVCK